VKLSEAWERAGPGSAPLPGLFSLGAAPALPDPAALLLLGDIMGRGAPLVTCTTPGPLLAMGFQSSSCSASGTAAHTPQASTARSSAEAVGRVEGSRSIPG